MVWDVVVGLLHYDLDFILNSVVDILISVHCVILVLNVYLRIFLEHLGVHPILIVI